MAEGRPANSRLDDAPGQVRDHVPDCGPAEVLEYLSDHGCRAILAATGRPRTAAELCEICEMPTSTVYRKLEALSDAGLLAETRRLRDHGNHPVQYRRRVDEIRVSLDGIGGIEVQVGVGSESAQD